MKLELNPSGFTNVLRYDGPEPATLQLVHAILYQSYVTFSSILNCLFWLLCVVIPSFHVDFIAWFSSRSCRNLISCFRKQHVEKEERASIDGAEDIMYLSHMGCTSTRFYPSSLFLLRAQGLKLESKLQLWSRLKRLKKTSKTQQTLPSSHSFCSPGGRRVLLFKQISQKQHQGHFTDGCTSVFIKSSVSMLLCLSRRFFWPDVSIQRRQGQMNTDGGLLAVTDGHNGCFCSLNTLCQAANITLT